MAIPGAACCTLAAFLHALSTTTTPRDIFATSTAAPSAANALQEATLKPVPDVDNCTGGACQGAPAGPAMTASSLGPPVTAQADHCALLFGLELGAQAAMHAAEAIFLQRAVCGNAAPARMWRPHVISQRFLLGGACCQALLKWRVSSWMWQTCNQEVHASVVRRQVTMDCTGAES